MLPLCYFAFLSLLSPVLSIECNETQYEWPVGKPQFCCEKCKPGQYLHRRNNKVCDKECKPCINDRYSDTHNVDMYCGICDTCTKPNMEYKSRCNATHNAVCSCKAGYKCKDQNCKECLLVPTTTESSTTLPPSTTALKSTTLPTASTTPTPLRDTAWFLVIIVLLCIGFAFFVVTNIEPFLRWIRTKHGYFLAKPAAPVHSEVEEVSKPVQEVCGKCEQPLEV
ncbi:CD27 antigen [Larimichthys crocea]|uniref:CD27 antigen n=1 Tax=Larimichthys crocea TaxID=215358 RepID=UPI000901A53C|nr:CD27 antigen [Larimichthys crocea]